MKVKKNIVITIIIFGFSFLIFLCTMLGFYSPWSKPLVVGKGEMAAFGECGDYFLIIYGSSYISNDIGRGISGPISSIYAILSNDGENWSEPKLLSKMNDVFFSTPSIIPYEDGIMVIWDWSQDFVEGEKIKHKREVVFVKTNDCQNWSVPETIETLPFEAKQEEKEKSNYLLSIMKLRNDKIAILWHTTEKVGDQTLYHGINYSESFDLLTWSQKEDVPMSENVSTASLFEEEENKIIIPYAISDSYTINISERKEGIWTNTRQILDAEFYGGSPFLMKVSPEEYWLFYKSGWEIYYATSHNLKEWSNPMHITRESTNEYLGNSPILLKNNKIWIQYISHTKSIDYSSPFNPESSNEIKIRYYDSTNKSKRILFYMIIPTLFSLIFTGMSVLLLRFLDR